jgi:ABC-type nitrate/sulfonate/bicarbonate transport system ATPase subunit
MKTPLSNFELSKTASVRRSAAKPSLDLFRLERLVKGFGQLAALEIDQLAIQEGEIVVIVGPSGCGKTTLLNCMAGLEPVSDGQICFRGKEVGAPLQSVGMVYQRSSVFPWFTVRQNLRVPATLLARLPTDAVDAALERFGLARFGEHWPRELSGGMLRRLELARAMLREPAALLLDEPFSALDPVTKAEMHQLVRQLRREHGVGIVLVTHDVEEAIALADRIVVMTPRPGSVAGEIKVSLADSQRTIHSTDADFFALKQAVLAKLGWGLGNE